MRLKFVDRLKKRSRPDLWSLSDGAREVILARLSRAMSGRLTAAESRRMIVEKQVAGMRAYFAWAHALLDGKPQSSSRAVFNIYHSAVQSNRRRLRKRVWR
jgi:hypothetical protein